MSKEYKSWDAKGTAAQQLIDQFELFDKTDGAAGINHKLNKPKDIINEIYNTCPFLQTYNPGYFANNFRKLRNNWQTSKAKTAGRRKNNKKSDNNQTGANLYFYFIVLLFYFLQFVSFFILIVSNLKEEESPPKKRKILQDQSPAESIQDQFDGETLGSEDSDTEEEQEEEDEYYSTTDQEGEISTSEGEKETTMPPTSNQAYHFTTPTRKKKSSVVDTATLSGMMNDSLNVSSAKKPRGKKKKIQDERGLVPSGAPFLLYHWEDRNSNNRLTLEVLLFGAIDQKKLSLNLGESNPRTGEQSLFLTNPLPPPWLSMKEFENNSDMEDYNTIKQHGARKSHLVELDARHSSTLEGNQILSQQAFVLPYEVENFNSQHPYDGTGFYLEKRPVVKRSKKGRSEKTVDIMNVLVVQMVSEEKCSKNKIKKSLKPKFGKACTYDEASSSSSDDGSSSSDDDADTQRRRGVSNQRRKRKKASKNTKNRNHSTKNSNNGARSNFASSSFAGSMMSYDDDDDKNEEENGGGETGRMDLSFETAGGSL